MMQTRTQVSKNPSEEGKILSEMNLSRKEIMEQLDAVGVDTEALKALPIDGLESLRMGISALLKIDSHKRAGRPKGSGQSPLFLSSADKKILQGLLSSEGHVSSLTLSRDLDIPQSTLQRRRQRLEENFVERNYSLKIDKFGWKTGLLFVSTTQGKANLIGKEVLEMSDTVISVTRMMGESFMDLKVDILFSTNSELLSLMDRIKSIEGVKGVVWVEQVEILGRNKEYYKRLVDSP